MIGNIANIGYCLSFQIKMEGLKKRHISVFSISRTIV